MVQILVKCEQLSQEWVIIELQGFLEGHDATSFDGLPIGDLHFDDKGQPCLVIGHHLLNGRIVTLDKPFGVLRKMKVLEDDREPDTCTTEYSIEALVKTKVIFKTRPKPIIIKSEKEL